MKKPILKSAESHRRNRRGEGNNTMVIVIIIVVVVGVSMLACAGVGLALLLPATQQARTAARQAQSRNNLHMIGLALHNYHDVHAQFPPGSILAEDGTPRHGWQTMLLPYVDAAPVYNNLDFGVGWTDPANAGMMNVTVPTYLNPSVTEQFDAQRFALSHYAGNSQVFQPNGTIGIRDITDGSSNTVLVGEVAAGFKPWGDPTNVRDPADGFQHDANTFGSQNRVTVGMLMVDGAVRQISADIDPSVLKAIATPSGNEVVDPNAF